MRYLNVFFLRLGSLVGRIYFSSINLGWGILLVLILILGETYEIYTHLSLSDLLIHAVKVPSAERNSSLGFRSKRKANLDFIFLPVGFPLGSGGKDRNFCSSLPSH